MQMEGGLLFRGPFCIILTALPLQQWFHERISQVLYTYRTLPVLFSTNSGLISGVRGPSSVSMNHSNYEEVCRLRERDPLSAVVC
jgi:hypothetical protein